jgi:hypothetical protein
MNAGTLLRHDTRLWFSRQKKSTLKGGGRVAIFSTTSNAETSVSCMSGAGESDGQVREDGEEGRLLLAPITCL